MCPTRGTPLFMPGPLSLYALTDTRVSSGIREVMESDGARDYMSWGFDAPYSALGRKGLIHAISSVGGKALSRYRGRERVRDLPGAARRQVGGAFTPRSSSCAPGHTGGSSLVLPAKGVHVRHKRSAGRSSLRMMLPSRVSARTFMHLAAIQGLSLVSTLLVIILQKAK